MASPLTRTYTPPTCTLEVTAQPSALSRWTNTPVVKSLQFILSLEGLAQGDREPVALRGDQTQLLALSEAVSSYVQRLVSGRPIDFPLKPAPQPEIAPSPTREGLFDEMAHPVHLRTRSLFTHELILGDLATPESGSSITLKASQLYDLATALEDCAADLKPLPVATPATSARRIPAWAKTAAAIAVTAGVGTATWQLLQPSLSPVPQTAQAPTGQQAPTVTITPPPQPETRQRKSVDLPAVTLPNRSGQPFTIARSNPGDRFTPNPDLFASSKSATKTTDTSKQQSSVKFEPLPPDPPKISSNIPETAIRMGGSSTAESSPADNAVIAQSPAASGAAMSKVPQAEMKIAPTARTRQGTTHLFTKDAAPPPAIAPVAPPAQPIPAPAKPSEELFDITPQILEARRTVESKSQRTAPTRVVEYRLVVNPNGTLAAIEPLGQAAQQYLPKLSLAVGQPFVSASSQRSQIRLVVRPDGTVQTFPDSVGN